MSFKLLITKKATKDLERLPIQIADRIRRKLKFFIGTSNPFSFAKSLTNLPPATHRFQIGNYRARFFVENQTICITKVELRGQDYRRR